MRARPPAPPTWVFDESPPSGARRGGDPAEHAFKRDVETFVREVVQNANDQARAGTGVEVRFTLQKIAGGELAAFFEAAAWSALEPHLAAAAKTRRGARFARALESVKTNGSLTVLRIEDRGTRGLPGGESEGESHFRALCKDTLYSEKADKEAAGGSYGLGKSVLWSFSGISTVLFFSHIDREDLQGDQRSPRLIGRSELPSHDVRKVGYTGSGWFGARGASHRGHRAESLWSVAATQAARELLLEREKPAATGTSILVLDFREPAADENEHVPRRIAAAAARYFWPAMALPRALRLTVGGAAVDPEAHAGARGFLACIRATAAAALRQPGDVVEREIEIDLPAPRDGGRAERGVVMLRVRLAETDAVEHVGEVAWFRGPGMVVRYDDQSALALATRPFQATLACGLARAPVEPTETDFAVERFLRAAEPPGHDSWESTPYLKEQYKKGYAKALAQLQVRVREALRDVLAQRIATAEHGPERLERRFPLDAGPGRAGAPSAFRFTKLVARIDGDEWAFAGRVGPVALRGPWSANVRLRAFGDDGAGATIAIRTLDVDGDSVALPLDDGSARIDVASGARDVGFHGTSELLRGLRTPLELEVTGESATPTEGAP